MLLRRRFVTQKDRIPLLVTDWHDLMVQDDILRILLHNEQWLPKFPSKESGQVKTTH